jgi:phenylalanyl-tRNA synthetase beta chain
VTFTIPTFRPDLKREVDLIEEIARLHGVEKIPATPPRGAIGSNDFDAIHDTLAEARRILSGLGLDEAQGQTLISDPAARLVAPADGLARLANPLSNDMDTLRPSLLPGLLDALRHNLNRKNGDVALFEIGRVFASVQGQPREERRVASALTGRRAAVYWQGAERDARFDLGDLKGILEEFFDLFGIRGAVYARRPEALEVFAESAIVSLGGKVPLGELGQLSPLIARRYDLRDPVVLAELNLDQVLGRRVTSRSFKPLPAFPSVRRDVAMLVPEATSHEAVLAAVRQLKPAHLETIELFDVFRGQHVPAGQKSVAYAFTYRHPERTLTDSEVNEAHERLVEHLRQRLPAAIR